MQIDVVAQNTERLAASGRSRLLFQSPIDLQGNSAPEQLVLEARRLVVRGGEQPREERRTWPLERIQALRVEPAVGSCYLQAEVEGRWVDVFRCPGNVPAELTEFVDQFAANMAPDSTLRRSMADGQPRLSDWFAPRCNEHRPRRWRNLMRIVAIFRPFWIESLLLLGLSGGAVAIDVAPPLLQRYLVDDVLRVEAPASQSGRLLWLLLGVVSGLLAIRVGATLVGIWKGAIASRVGTNLTAELRDQLVQKLNALPLAFHDRGQVGMLMSRVAYDTENLHTLLYHMTSGLLLQLFLMAGISVALFYLNPKLALVTMFPMPLIVAGSWYFARYLNPRHQHYWDAVGKQAAALTGLLAGIRVVKAFVQEDRESARFRQSSQRLRDSRQIVDVSTSTFSSLMGFVFALGGLAVWYIGGRDVLFGRMSFGSLMAFLTYLAMFYAPLTSLTESTTWFSNFAIAMRRIFELLDTPDEGEETSPKPETPSLVGRVAFRQVSFGYDKNRPVLKDVDFTIEPGQIVGVVGRSGSGKSTLVSLIARLYEPDAGQIFVNGVDVRQLGARQLRRRIGMVPQEPFLFRGSIADNIGYGDDQATPEDILRAAKSADAHNFILGMPLAYHNQVGEGGTGLSGGERQRISIARALLFDPAILILDEATASVDAESERAICEAVKRFSRQRTTIAIAHRLSTLRDADKLLVFDQGRLIEEGSPEELLERGGLYNTLSRIQGNLSEHRRRMESALGGDAAREVDPADLGPDASFLATFPSGDVHRPSAAVARPSGDAGLDDAQLRWLDPARVHIAADGPGLLSVLDPRKFYRSVSALRDFPGSHDDQFVSLCCREPSGHWTEIGLIRNLGDWPPETVAAVRQSLARRYLLRKIRDVRQIRTEANVMRLSVLTESGPAQFELDRPRESYQAFGPRGLLLCDVQGNYFVIPDRAALPRSQRRLLALYFAD
jgi:ATP-binding cassette subfamily B protein